MSKRPPKTEEGHIWGFERGAHKTTRQPHPRLTSAQIRLTRAQVGDDESSVGLVKNELNPDLFSPFSRQDINRHSRHSVADQDKHKHAKELPSIALLQPCCVHVSRVRRIESPQAPGLVLLSMLNNHFAPSRSARSRHFKRQSTRSRAHSSVAVAFACLSSLVF